MRPKKNIDSHTSVKMKGNTVKVLVPAALLLLTESTVSCWEKPTGAMP